MTEERSGMVKGVSSQDLLSGSHDPGELLGCLSPEWELHLTRRESTSDADLLRT